MPRKAKTVPLVQYLTTAVAIARQLGWRPMRGTGWERMNSTAATAWRTYAGTKCSPSEKVLRDGVRLPDAVRAEAILSWFRSITPGTPYETEVAKIVQANEVRSVDAATAAGLIVLFDHKDRRCASSFSATSKYVGHLLQDIDLELRVICVTETAHEPTRSLVFTIEDGQNVVVFFWLSSKAMQLKDDQVIRVRGRVVNHAVYHGTKQTTLSRVERLS